MANAYDRGDLVRLSATFTDAAGAVADPTTVVLRLLAPDGTASTPATVKDSVGVYHYDLSITATGYWSYRWEGTGTVQTAEESQLYARVTQF